MTKPWPEVRAQSELDPDEVAADQARMLEEVRVQRLAEARAAGDDECAYLLASPANGRRLLGAIESLESGGGTIQNVDFE